MEDPITDKRSFWPSRQEINTAVRSLNIKTKFVLAGFFVVGTLCLLIAVITFNNSLMVEVAAPGGQVTEGIIGSPRFINPLLAISDADRDLTALVYSGLMRQGPNGQLIPDLAYSYEQSADGLEHTFILKDNIYWHDGQKITTADIEFTVLKAQDPLIKSPRRLNWEGVSVEVVDNRKIIFRLNQGSSSFWENTLMGILPKHLWSDLEGEAFSFSELNTKPIGSGPYKIEKIKRNSDGVPEYYDLERFKKFALGQANIELVRIRFFGNEDDLLSAWQKEEIGTLSAISPKRLAELDLSNFNVLEHPLPRVFGIFFNQNQAQVLLNDEVRQALDLVIDREKIVDEILFGFGQIAETAIPNNNKELTLKNINHETPIKEQAANILIKAGWGKNENGIWQKEAEDNLEVLSFNIATADSTEIKSIAELIGQTWRDFGAQVEVEVFETGALNQNVIRPRKYDALLFGLSYGQDRDPYPFWHSSQRLDPGLNVSMYTNIKADKLLEEMRTAVNSEDRQEKIEQFEIEIANDRPAIFLYTPHFIYIQPKSIKGISLENTTLPAERFINIHEWYIKTEKVWDFFAQPEKILN